MEIDYCHRAEQSGVCLKTVIRAPDPDPSLTTMGLTEPRAELEQRETREDLCPGQHKRPIDVAGLDQGVLAFRDAFLTRSTVLACLVCGDERLSNLCRTTVMLISRCLRGGGEGLFFLFFFFLSNGDPAY